MDCIIFLDVDGVLNTRTTKPGDGVREVVLTRPFSTAVFQGVVETKKVAMLRDTLEQCDADLVVSSSWREAFANAADFAVAIGLVDPLADEPDFFHRHWRTEKKLSSTRAQEIALWLAEHRKVRHYATLDDHDIFAREDRPEMQKRFVRTDADVGLTHEDLRRVEALLGYSPDDH